MGQGGEVTFIFDSKIKGTQTIQMVYNRGPVDQSQLDSISSENKKQVVVNIEEKSDACGAI